MSELILGIESSCDDTAVAIVDRHGNVLSSVISSQFEIHAKYGGVFPEFASRAHIESIIPAVKEALSIANVLPTDLRAIGVTRGPGLVGSLIVGLNTASGLGLGWGIPVIGVNHLRGHLRSVDIESSQTQYPSIVLLVSGGHTFLAYMDSTSDIKLLGSTRDDSVGEAYDKVSRMLGFGYPGGQIIDEISLKGKATIPFPRPMMNKGLDFSFSGLKSAVARYLSDTQSLVVEDVAASFVEAVMDTLATKCRRAITNFPLTQSLIVVGGVSASPPLRSRIFELCNELNIECHFPPLRWSTDNGAMIALAAWDYLDLAQIPRPIPQLQLSISEY